jgi:superoxide dismutase, Fe-Mn family
VGSTPLHELLRKIGELPESVRVIVRNNGGGHANHTMYWQMMGPDGGTLDRELSTAISRDFGTLESLQSQFNDVGMCVFGSGWVLVTVTPQGKLAIERRPN